MAAAFEIKIDASQFAAMAARFHNAKANMPAALSQAVNMVGPAAMRAMKIALPGQTGLKTKTIDKALKGRGYGGAYIIRSHGGNIRLKYFGARETGKGVTAAPWNSRRLYPATFIRAGWWPNRKQEIARGQVLRRKGESKYPMEVVRSGLFIPEEMVKGASGAAFYGTIDALMPTILEGILFGTIASSGASHSAAGARAINQRLAHVSLNDPIPF